MLKKQVRCGKYGLGATVYTHHDQSVLHCDASRDGGFPGGDPCAVRYLSLHDNKYLRCAPLQLGGSWKSPWACTAPLQSPWTAL